jgi:hypothetical protein
LIQYRFLQLLFLFYNLSKTRKMSPSQGISRPYEWLDTRLLVVNKPKILPSIPDCNITVNDCSDPLNKQSNGWKSYCLFPKQRWYSYHVCCYF